MSARSDGARCVAVWHRDDLRLHDNAAVHAAVDSGMPVIGVFVFDDNMTGTTSDRRRALLASTVDALRDAYRARGGELIVRTGAAAAELATIVRALGIVQVHATRPYLRERAEADDAIETALLRAGATLEFHEGRHVHRPGSVRTNEGGGYSVFSAYFRRWSEREVDADIDPPARIDSPAGIDAVDAGIVPDVPTDLALPEPGEAAALRRLEEFVQQRLADYESARNRLDGSGSSRLSMDLTVGALSPRVALHRVLARGGAAARKWTAELAWRDFMADLLWRRPELATEPFDPAFAEFEWNPDDAMFVAWHEGATGIPVVDAAMRELRTTGWISNRARMVAAQFLCKHLRVDWRRGEAVFRDWLLDADVASNVGNWQWAAGLGIDNAPYFRVFNPVTQGREHDPDGSWLRRWVPESDGSPAALPDAIVDIAAARRHYLAAVESVKQPAPKRTMTREG